MMALPVGPYLPTAPLVVVGWLSGVTGLNAGMVATTLPRDRAAWADEGFVQITMIPSTGPIASGDARIAYVQIDAWAVRLEANGVDVSSKRPVARAARLAELIIRGCEDDAQGSRFGRPVTLPANYLAARALSAWPLTEPTDVLDDPTGYARTTFDLALTWARL